MDQLTLNRKIDHFIKINMKAVAEDIGALVAIPSVEGKAAPGAPFGAEVRAALDKALAIADRLGLATRDGEGYLGWAEVPGAESDVVATVTHLDVVPPGSGWEKDPYKLREWMGWIIGRGVLDDKGPAVLTLYAARFLQELAEEAGRPHRYTFRALLGCNEESGMGDVSHYLKKEGQPLFCFSPDAEFPLCNGEKGLLAGNFTSAPLEGNIESFTAGSASNVIPDLALCVIKEAPEGLAGTADITVDRTADGGVRLEARGICGHAARPAGTRNAIGLLVEFLLENGLCAGEEKRFLELLLRLHGSTAGSGLGINCEDEAFGPLTVIGGTIKLEDHRLIQNINIRYPMAATGEGLAAALQNAAAEHGAAFTVNEDMPPFFIPADSAPIKALLAAYREVTGDEAGPFTIGGGTYARNFQNAVSFGPVAPGTEYPPHAACEHAVNEGVSYTTLRNALKIYLLSLVKLMELEL